MSGILSVWLVLFTALSTVALKGGDRDHAAIENDTLAWTRITEALGSVSLEGTLRRSYPLFQREASAAIGLSLILQHSIEITPFGKPRSRWQVIGLSSSLVPAGREQLRWTSLDGRSVLFARSELGPAWSPAIGDEGVAIRQKGDQAYELRTGSGMLFRYHRGCLRAIVHPSEGAFEVRSMGARITAISRAGENEPRFQVDYGPCGNVPRILYADGHEERFFWSEAELRGWEPSSGEPLAFRYHDGLLVEIRTGTGRTEHFEWAENPGWTRGDSRWPSPVRLVADGVRRYSCHLSQRGLHLQVSGPDGGCRAVINPRMNRMTFESPHEQLVVHFEGAGSGRRLRRVETHRGDIIEEYEYDAFGRLERIVRGGESLEFAYDSIGRALHLTGRNLPAWIEK